MRDAETYRQLTMQDWRLFGQAFMTLAVCRARLRCQNFAAVRAWAAKKGHGTAAVNRLSWSVEAAAKRMKRTTCLYKALALQRRLARNGYDSEIRIGVNKSAGLFTAHAWLVYQGRVLVGGAEMEDYTLLAAWAGRDAARGLSGSER